MPYQTYWDEQLTDLYHIVLTENWTWVEFREVVKISYEMLGKLERDIDLVIAFQSDLPIGSAIMHFTYAGEQPKNIRHTVLLNSTKLTTKEFVETVIGAVDRMKGWQGPKFVVTLGEARAYIRELRDKDTV